MPYMRMLPFLIVLAVVLFNGLKPNRYRSCSISKTSCIICWVSPRWRSPFVWRSRGCHSCGGWV